MRSSVLVLLLACGASAHVDEQCEKRRGHIFTGPATRPPSEQHSVCVMPASDADKPCKNGSDCQIMCACPEPLPPRTQTAPDAPLDDPEVTGTCATFPAASGGGWYCTVEGGRAHRNGIIVD